MDLHRLLFATVIWCALAIASPSASAAGAPDSALLLAAQRQSMQSRSMFDGTWRGAAKIILTDGKELLVTQTERVGSFLGDTVKLIEGRGYAQDGTRPFNAFAVTSYSPQNQKYNLRSYAQGYSGDFPLEVKADGSAWSIKAGPATLRYTATLKDGLWTELGKRIVAGQAPVKTFEMSLRRIGNTDWPAGGAVPAK